VALNKENPMIRWLALAGVLSLAAPAQEDESRLVHEDVVDAAPAAVWAAFTTKEGIESWMVPHAEIELKIGGVMKTNYEPKGKIGDPKTIENTILSFDPPRMISFKATKFPEGFPFPNAARSVWSVIYVDEADGGKTRVRVVGLGYGTDEESKKMRAFFKQGNAWTLSRLRKKFGAKDGTNR
jgi:uncharacterized protein YndB with AHSA1/START domain